MVRKNQDRNRRPTTPRSRLFVEALEDRTLLTGNVLATLNVNTGVLTINGDIGNNSITIANSPIAGDLRVTGNINVPPPPALPDATTVNSVPFWDYTLSSITQINITMLNGNDTVIINGGAAGLDIPNNINITAGTGADTFTLNGGTGGIVANNINITSGNTTAGNGNTKVSLTNTTAGGVTINTGTGADTVSANGGKVGTMTVNTGVGTANDSVTVQNFTSVGSSPGIGKLAITTADGTNTISVTNTTMTTDSIIAGNGSDTITVNSPQILTSSTISSGSGNDTISFTSASAGIVGKAATTITATTGNNHITASGNFNTLSVTTGGGGGAVTFDNSTAVSAKITDGGGANTVDVSNDIVTGAAGLQVGVGTTAGNTGLNTITVNNDTVSGASGLIVNVGLAGHTNPGTDNVTATGDTVSGPMTVAVADDGPQYWSTTPAPNGTVLPSSNLTLGKDSVGGLLTASAGNFFRNVTVGQDNSTNFVSAGSLSATIGSGSPLTSNSQTVLFNTHVSGAETINVGNFFATQPPIPALVQQSSFTLNGNAGSLSLTVGANAKGGVSQNATVSGTEGVSVGDNAGNVTVLRPTGGNDSVSVGNNAGSVSVSGTDTVGPTGAFTESVTVLNGSAGPVTVSGDLKTTGTASWTETVSVGNNVADGGVVVSVNVAGSETVGVGTGASKVTVSGTVTGAQSVTIGSGSANAGNSISGSAASLGVTLGDNDTLSVSSTIAGNETINGGNGDNVTVTSPSVGGAESLTFLANATVNVSPTAPGTVSSLGIMTGDGANITVSGVTASAASNAVNIGAGNGATISVSNVTATNDSVTVTALANASSVVISGVSALHGALTVTVTDNAGLLEILNTTVSSMSVGVGNGNTFIVLSGDNVGTGGADLGAGLALTAGNGNNTVELVNLNVLDGLFATLGSGINTLFAMNTVADFGLMDGGGGPTGGSDVYVDLGGNSGYSIQGFIGYYG
jgi:hypothetical protein